MELYLHLPPISSWCAYLIFYVYLHGVIFGDLFKISFEHKPKSVVYMGYSVVYFNKTLIIQVIGWV